MYSPGGMAYCSEPFAFGVAVVSAVFIFLLTVIAVFLSWKSGKSPTAAPENKIKGSIINTSEVSKGEYERVDESLDVPA